MTRYTLRLRGRDYGCFDSATEATIAGLEWLDGPWTVEAIL